MLIWGFITLFLYSKTDSINDIKRLISIQFFLGYIIISFIFLYWDSNLLKKIKKKKIAKEKTTKINVFITFIYSWILHVLSDVMFHTDFSSLPVIM